jgi:hypothetical protein
MIGLWYSKRNLYCVNNMWIYSNSLALRTAPFACDLTFCSYPYLSRRSDVFYCKGHYVSTRKFILPLHFFCSHPLPLFSVGRPTERRVNCRSVNEVFLEVRPLPPAVTRWGLFYPLRSGVRLPSLCAPLYVCRSGFWLSGAEINCKLKNSLISSRRLPSAPQRKFHLSPFKTQYSCAFSLR